VVHFQDLGHWIDSRPRNGKVALKGIVMPVVRMLLRFIGVPAFAVTLAFGPLLAGPAAADDVKIGIPFDVTGQSASAVLPLLDAVKLAVDEVNANGGILKGQKLQMIVVDSKSTVQGSVDAANKLVKDDNVAAIVGGWTSASLLAIAHSVTIPNSVVLVSPAATAPIISTMENKGFVFRTILSDAYQGWMLGKLVYEQGFRNVALTYINNDYGSGIADTFRASFENLGGTITQAQAHEPNKSSYLPDLTALAQGKPEALVLIAYPASSGITIIKESLANGFFKQFIGTDSLRDGRLIKQVGADNLKGLRFTSPVPVPDTSALAKFEKIYSTAYKTTSNKRFIENTYDAVIMTALAIEQAGSTDRTKIRRGLRNICCAPGEVIEPGEWAKAKADIAAGTKIHYLGASGPCDFDENGDVTGAIGQFIVENGQFKQVGLVTP
jgi:branched-chain amino acid transport system substrate-binding protein